MADQMLNVLVEGFDPEKAVQKEQQDQYWQEVIAAYQNRTVLQAEMSGIEHKLGQPCGIVQMGHIRGYIPLEETGCDNIQELRVLLGTKIAFRVLNYDRENDVFTASRKAALEFMAALTWSRLEEGQVVLAVVRKVSMKEMRVDIGGISVKIPVQEVDHGWLDDLRERYAVGDHLKVKVMEVDRENEHVTLSAKALKPSPFPDCAKRYTPGSEYAGTVTGVVEYGVFVNLEPGVDVSTPHLKFEKLRKGERVLVRIRDVNVDKEKIYGKIVRKL